MWQSALSLLGLKANQGSLFNKVSLLLGQKAIRPVLLQCLVYPVVFVRGFHHRTCPMQACAKVSNGVQAITGHPVHTIQASVLTMLVFVVPQSATPSIQLLNRFRFKQRLPHLPPMHAAWVCNPSSVRRRLMLASATSMSNRLALRLHCI